MCVLISSTKSCSYPINLTRASSGRSSMFKAIAIILIFASCTLIGCYQSMQLNRRKTLLTEFRDFVQRLHTEMGYFKEPLPVILQKLHKDTDSPIDILLRHCLIQLETNTHEMAEIWTALLFLF